MRGHAGRRPAVRERAGHPTPASSGEHRHDWDPHAVRVEPLLRKAKPGATLQLSLVVNNRLPQRRTLVVTLQGRGRTPDQSWEVGVGKEFLNTKTGMLGNGEGELLFVNTLTVN